MENQKVQKLFKEIACCENVCDYFHGRLARKGKKPHPCYEIIRSQFGLYDCTYNNYENDCSNFKDNFQIPEPWSGHIDTAPLLFLGSNPNIDAGSKDYPRFKESCCSNSNNSEQNIEKLMNFYNERFNKVKNDTEKNIWNPYWKRVDRMASWLYGKEVISGCDYALSEVVHCKSKVEGGVGKALKECSKKYLKRLLDIRISPAKVVVVLGTKTKDALEVYLETEKIIKEDKWKIKLSCQCPRINKSPKTCNCDFKIYKQININNNNSCRYFIFAYHPSYCKRCYNNNNFIGFIDCSENTLKITNNKLFQEIQECLKLISKKPDCNSEQGSK